jgi:transcriptional regulator with XRE-family HTH domain
LGRIEALEKKVADLEYKASILGERPTGCPVSRGTMHVPSYIQRTLARAKTPTPYVPGRSVQLRFTDEEWRLFRERLGRVLAKQYPGLSGRELARVVKIPSLRNYTSGQSIPTSENLEALAERLQISPAWLAGVPGASWDGRVELPPHEAPKPPTKAPAVWTSEHVLETILAWCLSDTKYLSEAFEAVGVSKTLALSASKAYQLASRVGPYVSRAGTIVEGVWETEVEAVRRALNGEAPSEPFSATPKQETTQPTEEAPDGGLETNPMATKYVVVTPEQARAWLEKQAQNRSLSDATVRHYVHEMRSGKWVAEVSGILFDAKGQLRDGQHRLTAVVRFGAPVRMRVETNVPEDVFQKVDMGRARKFGDILRMNGDPNGVKSVAALNALYWVETGQKAKVAGALFEDMVENLGEEAVARVGQISRTSMSAGVRAAFLYAWPVDPVKVDELIKIVVAQEKSYGLLKALLAAVNEGGPSNVAARRTMRGIQAYLEGENAQRLMDTDNGYLYLQKRRAKLGLPTRISPKEYGWVTAKADE